MRTVIRGIIDATLQPQLEKRQGKMLSHSNLGHGVSWYVFDNCTVFFFHSLSTAIYDVASPFLNLSFTIYPLIYYSTLSKVFSSNGSIISLISILMRLLDQTHTVLWLKLWVLTPQPWAEEWGFSATGQRPDTLEPFNHTHGYTDTKSWKTRRNIVKWITIWQ